MSVPGVEGGSYVPLTVDEFRRGYAYIMAVGAGQIEAPPMDELPVDVATGKPLDLPDTPFNRAWLAACRMLDGPSKQTSFGQRIMRLLPIACSPAYARYRDDATMALDVSLMAAMAQAPFGYRTTPKALRDALATEFKRQMSLAHKTPSGEAH